MYGAGERQLRAAHTRALPWELQIETADRATTAPRERHARNTSGADGDDSAQALRRKLRAASYTVGGEGWAALFERYDKL